MIKHMRNIGSISIRGMISVVEDLFLVLIRVDIGELDELFAI
jgi:hypothetical protein